MAAAVVAMPVTAAAFMAAVGVAMRALATMPTGARHGRMRVVRRVVV